MIKFLITKTYWQIRKLLLYQTNESVVCGRAIHSYNSLAPPPPAWSHCCGMSSYSSFSICHKCASVVVLFLLERTASDPTGIQWGWSQDDCCNLGGSSLVPDSRDRRLSLIAYKCWQAKATCLSVPGYQKLWTKINSRINSLATWKFGHVQLCCSTFPKNLSPCKAKLTEFTTVWDLLPKSIVLTNNWSTKHKCSHFLWYIFI